MSATDREREQFEALVAAYRQLPRAEPPPELDRTVLEAARRAIAHPRASRPRWPAVLGTAATLVLAIGLAWRMRDQDLRAPPPSVQGPASTTETVATPAESSSAGMETASSSERKDTPAVAEQDGEARRQEALRLPSGKPDDTSGAGRAREAQDAQSAPRLLDRARTPVAAPAAPPPPPAPPAPVQDMRAADAAQAEERAAAREAAESHDDAELQSVPAPVLAEPFPADSPAASAPLDTAPAPPSPGSAAAPAPDSAADAAAAAAPRGVGGIYKRSPEVAERQDPEAWIEEIRRLLRQGQRDRARERLAAFREAYPDAEVPDDLRNLGR